MPSSYTIGERYEAMVRDLVESGRYASASEVIRDGLRMMEEREALREIKLKWLREEIQKGFDSGPGEPWDIEKTIVEAKRRHPAKNAA